MCSDDVSSAKQISRPRPNLTIDDMVVRLGVALDNNLSDSELLALHHADFNINCIVLNSSLNGNCLERQIPIILVQRTQIHPLWVHVNPGF